MVYHVLVLESASLPPAAFLPIPGMANSPIAILHLIVDVPVPSSRGPLLRGAVPGDESGPWLLLLDLLVDYLDNVRRVFVSIGLRGIDPMHRRVLALRLIIWSERRNIPLEVLPNHRDRLEASYRRKLGQRLIQGGTHCIWPDVLHTYTNTTA